jgi:poly(3-hydroxybutyrate) depolymerase
MTTTAPHSSRFGATRLVVSLLLVLATVVLAPAASPARSHASTAAAARVRLLTIPYVSHDGHHRTATLILPAWYGTNDNPPLPLVISPHGRGGSGHGNAKYWANMPAVGRFAVINPDGMGRRMKAFSYGYLGQIDDLARMPEIAMHALPWLHIDRTRIYALGSSMGGQETLLLVARHPHLLAGAAAMDSVADLALRYDQLVDLTCDATCMKRWGQPVGRVLQSNLRREVGGTPETDPAGYAARSGLDLAPQIAASRVPLQIWWSRDDHIVTDQQTQSGAMFKALRKIDRCAPVSEYVGHWAHSHEMRASSLLRFALAGFGLVSANPHRLPHSVTYVPAPSCSR